MAGPIPNDAATIDALLHPSTGPIPFDVDGIIRQMNGGRLNRGPVPFDKALIVSHLHCGPIPYDRRAVKAEFLQREHNNPTRPDSSELALLLKRWPVEVACPHRLHTALRMWNGFGFALDTHAGPPCSAHR